MIVTVRVACPPKLLRTVILCGLTDKLNCALNRPPPLLVNAPTSWPVEVTKACSFASARVLVASMRSVRLADSYSARAIETVSTDGVGVGAGVGVVELIVRTAERDVPLRVAVTVAVVVAETCVVLTVKLADEAPAATVTLDGTDAAALLLDSRTVVAV